MEENNLSAKAWVLMDADSQVYLRGSNTHQAREMASLSKMYTLYACLCLNGVLKIDPSVTLVQTFDTRLTGTLAHLQPNLFLTLQDLYYGLMLPSGNDAATILASYYGLWLMRGSAGKGRSSLSPSSNHFRLYGRKFIQYLNREIVKELLGHRVTKFQNPHGLSDKNQVTNAWQLAEATLFFLKNPDFATITSSTSYKGHYKDSDLSFEWNNTNILLSQGYEGVKTGYTTTAGGCLASIRRLPVSKYQSKRFLIVVLGCSSPQTRFDDTRQIIGSYRKYLKMMSIGNF